MMLKGRNGKLPGQNDYQTFCMSEETEKVYRKLEEVIGICWEIKKAEASIKKFCLLIFLAPCTPING